MFSPDELSAGLPARRDDEPTDLRRDIIDELGDHLACAMRRELLTDRVSESEAKRRVVARFGDPAAIVRRLWQDALWERIMSRRIVIGMCAATLLMCAAAIGLAWTWMDRWQASSAAQLEQQREMFQQLVESSQATTRQLAEQAKASAEAMRVTQELLSKSQPLSEWSPVEIRCVIGSEDGPPAEGIQIQMAPTNASPGSLWSKGTTDANGLVKFSKVHFGAYEVAASTSSDDAWQTDLNVLPGEGATKTIICPPKSDGPLTVKPVVQWPDDLKGSGLILKIPTRRFQRKAGSVLWSVSGDGFVNCDSLLLWEASKRPPLLADVGESWNVDENTPDDLRANDIRIATGDLTREREATALKWPSRDAIPASLAGYTDDFAVLVERHEPGERQEGSFLPASSEDSSEGSSRRFAYYRKRLDSAHWSFQFSDDTVTMIPSAEGAEEVRRAVAVIRAETERIEKDAERAAAKPASASAYPGSPPE
jgi:hypothetical protein